jgi:hypothetical protein
MGKFATCGHVAGVAQQHGFPEPCLLRFTSIYTGRQSWDKLRAKLNKSAEKQGFQFTVRSTSNSAQAMVCTLFCTRNRIFEDKACKREYYDGGAHFAAGIKVTMVKENSRVEQRGSMRINQPRKMERSGPKMKEDQCPFKINIPLNKKDDFFYLYKKGSVASLFGHVRRRVIFARADQIEKNVQKMLKDFDFANVKPSAASRVLHQIDDRVYNPKVVSNIIIKANNTCISERGINTKAASTQVLIDYLMISPDTSCVFLLHDPHISLTGGAKKGRPKKSSLMRVIKKYFNSKVVETEMVPDVTAEHNAIARRKSLYLHESVCLLLYAAWTPLYFQSC